VVNISIFWAGVGVDRQAICILKDLMQLLSGPEAAVTGSGKRWILQGKASAL
jgi:hypothetical protein